MGVFCKKEKISKKVAKFQSGIFGLFWTVSGIDSIAIFQGIQAKKNKKILKMGISRLKVS